MVMFFVLMFIMLFYIMYIISDKHFSPTLQAISHRLKLSPEIAACTLLAIGNGAPDFFTLQGKNTTNLMVLSSCISSSLIIFTCVFGAVIYFAYVPNRSGTNSHGLRPLSPSIFTRNAIVFFIGLCALGIPLYLEYIPTAYSVGMLVVYFIHITIVVYLEYNKKEDGEGDGDGFDFFAAEDELNSKVLDTETASVNKEIIKATSASSIRREQLLVLEKFHKNSFFKMLFLSLRHTSFREFFSHPMDGPSHFKWFLLLAKRTISFVFLAPISLTILPVDTGIKDSGAIEGGNHGDLDDGNEDIEQIVDIRYAAKRFLNRLRCTINPWFSIPFAFSAFYDIPSFSSEKWTYHLLVYVFLSSLASTTVWQTSSWFGAPSLTTYHLAWGFLMSMRWMLFIGDILNDALDVSGEQLQIPNDLLSMIVLAWGNTAPDIMSTISLARKHSLDGSGFKTASIAIFSAPIQNIFFSVGLTTLIKGDHSYITMNLTSSKVALCILGLFSVVTFLLIRFKFAFRIPRWFGGLLCIMYLVYLPFGILSSMRN